MDIWTAYAQRNPFADLTPEMVKTHWKTHRPKMYKELEESGNLDEVVETAINITTEVGIELSMKEGVSLYEAWMEVREEWVLLPSEEEVPELGVNPKGGWQEQEPNEEENMD